MLERVLVVGEPGSGKTTLAQKIADKTGGTHVQLDNHIWDPGWRQVSDGELQSRVDSQIANVGSYAIDGVLFGKLSDEFVNSLTDIVYLDLPFSQSFPRAVSRNWQRMRSREKVCGDNTEQLHSFVYTLAGLIFKHHLRKSRYSRLVSDHETANTHVFQTNDAANDWLNTV